MQRYEKSLVSDESAAIARGDVVYFDATNDNLIGAEDVAFDPAEDRFAGIAAAAGDPGDEIHYVPPGGHAFMLLPDAVVAIGGKLMCVDLDGAAGSRVVEYPAAGDAEQVIARIIPSRNQAGALRSKTGSAASAVFIEVCVLNGDAKAQSEAP